MPDDQGWTLNDNLADLLSEAWMRTDRTGDRDRFKALADKLRSPAGIAALRGDAAIWSALAREAAEGIADALDRERHTMPSDDPGRVALGMAAATALAFPPCAEP